MNFENVEKNFNTNTAITLITLQSEKEQYHPNMFRHSIVKSTGLKSCSTLPQFAKVRIQVIQQPCNYFKNYSTSHQEYSNKSEKQKIPIWAKIKAASTFTVASTVVIGAAGLAGLVIYLVVSEIILPSGDTPIFNKAVTLVEKDETSQKLLNIEPGTRLKAYGENTDNKWTRNRPIASTRRVDKSGKEHLFMRFHVESNSTIGTVQLETTQPDVLHSDFTYVFLDVPGEKRHYLVNPPRPKLLGSRDQSSGFLGIKWGPKHD